MPLSEWPASIDKLYSPDRSILRLVIRKNKEKAANSACGNVKRLKEKIPFSLSLSVLSDLIIKIITISVQ
jgi:hypothetical protein